jgi:hypothetical protein
VDASLEEDFVENSPVERLRGRDAEHMRKSGRNVYDADAPAESARRISRVLTGFGVANPGVPAALVQEVRLNTTRNQDTGWRGIMSGARGQGLKS